MFVHVVLFWMKPDAPAAHTEQLISDLREFVPKMEGLTTFDVGRPAMTPREVVDNSYHVGLPTAFADKAAHDAYQTHPSHLAFIARNKANWDRVKIYDFV